MDQKTCPTCGYVNIASTRRCKKCAAELPDEFSPPTHLTSKDNGSSQQDTAVMYCCAECGCDLPDHNFCIKCGDYVLRVNYIVLETDTYEEAATEFSKQLPEGYNLYNQETIRESNPVTITITADSVEQGLIATTKEIPAKSQIIKQRYIQQPDTIMIRVQENGQTSAVEAAKWSARCYSNKVEVRVQEVKRTDPGSRGIIGIGRRPEQYEVTFFCPAVIETTYIPQTKIRFLYAQPESIAAYYAKRRDRLRASMEQEIDTLITSLIFEYHNLHEKENLVKRLHGIEEVIGRSITSLRPKLYCKSCHCGFEKGEASTSEYDYDDGWFTRVEYSCPRCGKSLYDALGIEYTDTRQN